MLEIVALAAGALVSIGAATLGSWAILEVLLRLGETAQESRPGGRSAGETPAFKGVALHHLTRDGAGVSPCDDLVRYAAIAATNAATSGGTFPSQSTTLGLEEHRYIVRMSAQLHSANLAIQIVGRGLKTLAEQARFVFPIEAVAAVVALDDSGRPVRRANPSAVRQQDLSALLHQRAGQRRNQVHGGAGICLGMLRILSCRRHCARTRAGHAGSRRTYRETGGAVPARSVWRRSRPWCSHTGSPARTRFRRSPQARGPHR